MKGTARRLLARSLAATTLVILYGFTAIGLTSLVTRVPKAEARGRGEGRGIAGPRGRHGFRCRGFRGGSIWWGAPAYYGYGHYDDACWWSPRRGRWACPCSYW